MPILSLICRQSVTRSPMSKDVDRPIWFEGMTLDPHHLQQWDRYTQRSIRGQVSSAISRGWGFTRVVISSERLANGDIAIDQASGVFLDGLVFDVPSTDQPPSPRSIGSHFDPTADQLRVYLAVPLYRSQRSNLAKAESKVSSDERRYVRSTVSLTDETTGATERTIEVARPNLKILFEGEDMSGYAVLQIAEIVREGSGAITQNGRFIPPCLRVQGCSALAGVATRVLELAVAKMGEIQGKASVGLTAGDAASSDLKAVGIAAALGGYVPLLKEHGTSTESAPRDLYETMLALAGSLSVFAPSSTPITQFPLYEHDNLTSCFQRMEQVLREILGGTQVARTFEQIELKSTEPGIFTGDVRQEMLSRTRVILVVETAVPVTDSLVRSLESHMRVASPGSMNKALTAFLQALPFTQATRSVRGFAAGDHATQFELSKSGEYWDGIQNEEAITVWVPPECNVRNVSVVTANA